MNTEILKILLLEDNETTSNIITEFFSTRKSISIKKAGCIAEANAIFDELSKEINIILLDLYLPDGNGLDFLRSLYKKMYLFNNSKLIPAIIISSLISENIIKEGSQLGVVDYIEKPFRMVELFKVIQVIYSNRVCDA